MNPLEFYKNSDYYEIACMLFEPCNLKCKFCGSNRINKRCKQKYNCKQRYLCREARS